MYRMDYDYRYRKGDEVWTIPIRYWEQLEPERGIVIEDHGEDGLLVFSFLYGHSVYIDREMTYATRDIAYRAAALYAILYEMRLDDDMNVLSPRIYVHKDAPDGFFKVKTRLEIPPESEWKK